jgi:Protein of unknown function (DUF3592)
MTGKLPKSALARRVGLVLVVVSCAMLFYAISLAIKTREFLAEARITAGRVISLERSSSVRGSVYYPIVQFRTAAGQSITFRSSLANVAVLGQTVRVLYLPNNPDDARLDTYKALWFWPTLLGALAAICFLLGALFSQPLATTG